MSHAVRVAVVGFTTFERASFDTFFRLAPRRQPAYVMVDLLRECDVVVANADNPERLDDVIERNRLSRTLSVGRQAPPGVAAHLPRPINMMLVMRELDTVVRKQQAPSPSIQRVMDDFATITRNLDGSVDPRAEAAAAAAPLAEPVVGSNADAVTQAMPLDGRPPRRRGLERILVVDHNDQALRYMALHLERFGYQVSLARSGAQAIERVAHKHYAFVFLDAELVDVDAYLTCQAIKRSAHPGQRPAPTVVMMTRRADAVDMARSGLAGSDACVSKPLREADLLRVVGQREPPNNAYAETAHGTHTEF